MVIIPTIGAKGQYELSFPFENDIDPEAEYTCQSIRYLSEYISRKEDPFEEIYSPKNIPQETFLEDLKDANPIVGLQSAKGIWVYVPARYIVSWPSVDGVRYIKAMMTVDMGPYPADKDFTTLMTDTAEFVKGRIGVTPKVELVAVSRPVMVSFEQHDRVMQARANRITDDSSHYSKMKKLELANQSLLQKVRALEQYILTHESTAHPDDTRVSHDFFNALSRRIPNDGNVVLEVGSFKILKYRKLMEQRIVR